jgi:thioredoxin reductase
MITRRKLLYSGLLLTGGLLTSNGKKIARAENTTKNHALKEESSGENFDVAVVGGGVAGLQAALTLGRSCRKVIVFDSRAPRNTSNRPMHNFVGQDGVLQTQLLHDAREQLKEYDVTFSYDKVENASKIGDVFSVTTSAGLKITSKKVLMATGVKDDLPAINGLAALWGKSVLYCPYCSGWEVRGKALAVLGTGDSAAYAAMTLTGWSHDLLLLTNGASQLSEGRRLDLKKLKIEVIENKIIALEGQSKLDAIVLDGHTKIKREALFIQPSENHHCVLLTALGAKQNQWGVPDLDARGQTSVPGLYVAGDASGKAFQAIGAAADGAAVAFAMNRTLIFEALQSRGVAVG